MIPGSKQVLITRFGMTFWTTERIRDWIDWWTPLLYTEFPDAVIRLVQATRSLGPRSAGTHSDDNCFDFEVKGVTYAEFVWFMARHGGWFWWRHTGTWSEREDWHAHGGMLPPGVTYKSTKEEIGRALKAVGIKVGEYVDGGWTTAGRIYTSSQIYDWLHDSLGLKGQHASGIDTADRPDPIVIFDWEAYVANRRAWEENPMGQFVKEARELCKKAGISRAYGARLLLASAAKDAVGKRLVKINAGRTALYDLDRPTKK